MERILTFCKKLIDETGQEHLLYYWLLKKESEENDAETIYGIEIAKYKEEELLEQEKITGLSTSERGVMELIQKMARGNVTPMTLLPLADNFISIQTIPL